MSKSVDELLRELEQGGYTSGAPPTPPRRQSSAAIEAPASEESGSFTVLAIAVILVALLSVLPLASYVLYPVSLFVTAVHETGHAVAATLTGGTVSSLQINSNLSGVTLISGGTQALIAPAGYLGATLAGVGMLLLPLRRARWWLAGLAAIPALSLLFFHPADVFTGLWMGGFTLALAAASWILKDRWAAVLQIFLGMEMGLNAARDLMTLVFITGSNAHIQNDAHNMSQALFLPDIFWAVLWTVLSVALLAAALLRLVRGSLTSLPGLPKLHRVPIRF